MEDAILLLFLVAVVNIINNAPIQRRISLCTAEMGSADGSLVDLVSLYFGYISKNLN